MGRGEVRVLNGVAAARLRAVDLLGRNLLFLLLVLAHAGRRRLPPY
jgi:hypothetical protein